MRPVALIIAGPNGSGKSTLIRQLQGDPAFFFPDNYINADDIERELSVDGADTKGERERQAFREARRRRQHYREECLDHAFETVFSHASNLLDMQRLRNAGYQLTLCFVATQDATLNVERVKRRVQAGGHYVPEEKVRARYQRSLKFVPRAAETADITYLYDNSDLLTLLGYFTEGVWNPTASPIPTYVHEAFVQQMEARQTERKTMAVHGGDEGLELPDEENGHYTGAVVAVSVNYLIHEVVEGNITTRYRHDSIWLSDPPHPEWVGKTASIHYGQAEYGLASVSFPQQSFLQVW